MSTLLQIKNLEKSFSPEKGNTPIFSDFSLDCQKGEFLSILGATGCGKTTLLRMIAGLDLNYSGSIELNGKPITQPSKRIGLVFQHSTLFPWLTVEKNVCFSLKLNGIKRKERLERAEYFINLVGLKGAKKLFPHQLSGGMRMRTSLARALAHDAELLLLDEPFSALDDTTRGSMQDELLKIWDNGNKTMIMVTHNISEAERLSTRQIKLTDCGH